MGHKPSNAAGLPKSKLYIPQLAPFQQMRWRLVLFVLLFVFVTLGVIELITLPRMQTQAEEQIFKQLDSVAKLKQDQITIWFNNSQASLNLLLTEPFIEKLAQVLSTSSPSSEQQEALNKVFRNALASAWVGEQPLFTNLFAYTPNGYILLSADPMQTGKNIRRYAYYRPSIENSAQKPYYPLGSATLSMVLTKQVYTPDHGVVGIVAAQLNMEFLSSFMVQRSGLGDTGETYLVSRESNYLLTPSRAEGSPLTQACHSIGVDTALAGENGAKSYADCHTTPVLGVYRWLPSLNAALLAEISQAEAFKEVSAAQSMNLGAALVIALVAIVMGMFFAAGFTRPIQTLTMVATRIAQGDLEHRVPVQSNDELGILAITFNSMAEQLKQMLQELEQRVAARTMDLQQALEQREQTLADLQASLSVREQLSATIRMLSSPILPVGKHMLVVPLIGVLDPERAGLITHEILHRIEVDHPHTLIIDVTGVPLIDNQIAMTLVETAQATRLLGVQPVLVGIRPDIAQTMVSLGVDLSILDTQADLQTAIVRYEKV